ncbi:MAG: chemotaxis protein [Rhizobiales bacterium]|nr:chemotaxis protein [Hyphomicrobiales bacterium]
MTNVLGMTIESLVAILLLLTILYCVRLNNGLKQLKADERTMKGTIAELVTATANAERAIAGLKATLSECDKGLDGRLKNAERLSNDLARQLEAGGAILSRLMQIAGATRKPAEDAEKPAAPDAKAVVAAAQAFAERARKRAGGLAA